MLVQCALQVLGLEGRIGGKGLQLRQCELSNCDAQKKKIRVSPVKTKCTRGLYRYPRKTKRG